MKVIQRVTLGLVFLLAPSFAQAATVHLDSCTGDAIGFRNAKAACKSGTYPGRAVVTCNNKGKQKDRRLCSRGQNKVGIYTSSCLGEAIGFTNLNDACSSGNYYGNLLVKCRNGEEKARRSCQAATASDDRVVLFKDRCGSSETVDGSNLAAACKIQPGETLVKCRKKSDSFWKPVKAMHCQGQRDRFKFKNCSADERSTLISDYEIAEARIDDILSELEALLASDRDMSRKLRRKMEVVRRKTEKIQTAMDRPRTYVCRANRNDCGRFYAHTLGTGANVKVCDQYFAPSAIIRASTIVHEISHHKVWTTDKGEEHGGCEEPTLATADSSFENHAEYYEHITECGLYVPE